MDFIAARIRALEMAIDGAPNGTKWDAVLGNAKQLSDFIISGKIPDQK